jgi:hypothetical protein
MLRSRTLRAVTLANEQVLGTFSAHLFAVNDDRFFVQNDLAALLADPAHRKIAWTIVVTSRRVLLGMKHRSTDVKFAFGIEVATFEPAGNSPGMAFLELGPNTLGCEPTHPAGLFAIETAFRLAHGESEPISPAASQHFEQIAIAGAVRRARFRRRVRRFVIFAVIIGALWGGNALYQSHREDQFKLRCVEAGGATSFMTESLFDFSGSCIGPEGRLLFTQGD